MSIANTIVLLFAMSILSSSVAAQQTELTLPKDGWWVAYSIKHTAHVGEKELLNFTKVTTCSFVGTVTEDGELYRWVEIKMVESRDGNESTYLSKLLIPEKVLLESAEPLDKFKRGWTKFNTDDVREAKHRAKRIVYHSPNLFFPGMWHKNDPISDERIVDYQQGRLKLPNAEKLNITLPEWTENAAKGKQAVWKENVEYIGWFDPATSPFVTAARIRCYVLRNDELNTTHRDDIELQNYGTDAKSQLPDKN